MLCNSTKLVICSTDVQNGLNALHLAAKEGHVNVVSELLKRGANVNATTKVGIDNVFGIIWQKVFIDDSLLISLVLLCFEWQLLLICTSQLFFPCCFSFSYVKCGNNCGNVLTKCQCTGTASVYFPCATHFFPLLGSFCLLQLCAIIFLSSHSSYFFISSYPVLHISSFNPDLVHWLLGPATLSPLANLVSSCHQLLCMLLPSGIAAAHGQRICLFH